MATNEHNLHSWDTFSWSGRRYTKATCCYLAKVFYFFYDRNAWHARWAAKYPGDDAFLLSLYDAQKCIEKKRVQGSQWGIRELPVIVLKGHDVSVCILEINEHHPFSSFTASLGKVKTLRGIGKSYHPTRPDSIKRFIYLSDDILPAEFPFYTYQSHSSGGAYELYWRRQSIKWKLDSILNEVNSLTLHIQNVCDA